MNDLEHILKDNPIIIYDGICGFCNKSVQFILDNKPNPEIRFVAFQSQITQKLIAQKGISPDMKSILFIENNKIYNKSTAVLRILKHTGSPWKYLYYLLVIPSPVRNFVYSIISQYRYLIMGKSDQCRLLSKEERLFFLE